MSHSYCTNLIHCVFSTKDRQPSPKTRMAGVSDPRSSAKIRGVVFCYLPHVQVPFLSVLCANLFV